MPNNYIIVMDKTGGAHLEHKAHKYTKREWQNGKWRYWYGTGYKQDAEAFRKYASDAHRRSESYKKEMSTNKDENGNLRTDRFFATRMWEEQGGIRSIHANDHGEEANFARAAYNSQKLYEKSLAGRIEKGKKIIDSLFKKLKKNVNETAIKTAKKLGLKTDKVETRRDISTGQTYKRVNGGPWEKVK